MQVNILDAKNRLSQLVKAAQAGEEVVIANRGAPVARLVRIEQDTPYPPGTGHAVLAWLERNPLPAHHRRGHAEIEADIAEERSMWD